jgi:hypothetical protein
MVYYSTFGPTVIGTNVGIHHILETRAIPINMPQTSRQFENDVTPQIALPYKERLLAFRARHMGKVLPNIHKPTSGRLGDILKPLHQVIKLVNPEKEMSFLNFVRKLQTDRKIEKSLSVEAEVLSAILGLEDQVVRGLLQVKAITESFNSGKSERHQIGEKSMGWILKSLGFGKGKLNNKAAVVWNDRELEQLKDEYDLRKTYETHETDVSHVTQLVNS